MRSTSAAGLALIKRYEGLKLKAYLCPAKVATIGYGSTRYHDGRRVVLTDKLTNEAEATQLLLSTLNQFETVVNKNLPNVNQCQFDALVSLCYNIGGASFAKSTLVRKAKVNPNDPSILDEFMRWNKAGGKVLAGLTTRRADEAKLYFKECKD
jgi:lysozyme